MALVTTNPIVNGLSGMLGKTIVFKSLRGKTIVASRPRPAKTQSEQQHQNRNKSRQAAYWAKTILRDPQQKSYYQYRAKKLKLPNAYTAAITDYMRKPQLKEISRRDDTVCYVVRKKDFDLRSGALQLSSTEETTLHVNEHGAFVFSLGEQGQQHRWQVTVVDHAGLQYVLIPASRCGD